MPAPRPLTRSVADLENSACLLRSQGNSYEEIANRLGLSGKGQAYRICQRALHRIPAEGVGEMRNLEGQRLDAMTFVLWPKVMGGDLPAISALLRTMERRARLFGLDASNDPVQAVQTTASIDEASHLAIERVSFFEDLVAKGLVTLPVHLCEGDLPSDLTDNDHWPS